MELYRSVHAAPGPGCRLMPLASGAGTATTAIASLHVTVWLRDLDALYDFLTADLAGLDVRAAETILVGRVIKRPGTGRVTQT
jgi:hypothetical protein